jgi:PAS domain S-box-containing protein
MSKAKLKLVTSYTVAILASLVALIIRFLLNPILGENAPLLVLVMAIIVSAWYGGFGPGLLATVVSAVLGAYFFVQPTLAFEITEVSNTARVCIFVIEGVLISWLNEALRNAKQRAELTALSLKESEERYRLLVDGVKDYAIFMLDPDGRITSWNEGAERMKGYRAAEILGKHFSIFYTTEDIERHKPEQELQIAVTEGHHEEENWRRRKDGSLFWAHVVMTALRDKTGKLQGIAKITRDVTERKQAEEKLQASIKQLSDIKFAIDKAAILVATDRKGGITYVNDKFCQISKYSRKELIGQNHRIINSGHHPKEFFQNLWSTITSGKVWHGEIRNKAKDGTYYWVDTTIVPFLDTEGYPVQYFAIRFDITERVQLREELQHYAAELEQHVSERTTQLQEANSELEAFAYSIAHDLRAPLRSIQGFSEALLEDYADRLDATGRSYSDRIIASTKRMDNLITDLLAYSRLSRTEIQLNALNLTSIMAEVLTQLEAELQEHKAKVIVEESLPIVMGHRTTLVQVFTNLIANAVKFVACDVQPRVRVWPEESDEWIRIWVEDNGIGIAPQYQERIFQVFERLHSSDTYPGTGIGLAIVRKGVERMEGQVGVESQVGQGSRFWIELRNASNS